MQVREVDEVGREVGGCGVLFEFHPRVGEPLDAGEATLQRGLVHVWGWSSGKENVRILSAVGLRRIAVAYPSS
ncbi:hypothetical protein [Halorussus litoreus]